MEKEFPIIFESIRDKVFRFATRILNDPEDARDAVQDVFEKMWKMSNKTHIQGNVEALSMTITKNLCLDKLKHEKQKQHKLQLLRVSHKPVSLPVDYDQKNTFQVIRGLIDELPEKQRMVIHLRDVEGLSFKEIATIMDTDIPAVRMNVSRARKTVKEQLIKTMNYGL
jgi:RNA polymerase sigma-70 factor (ECF subfamily)